MVPLCKPRGFWTFEECAKTAKKYTTRNDFQIFEKSAYSIALKKNWLNDICKHMHKPKSHSKKVIKLTFNNVIVDEYCSLTEASLKNQIQLSKISSCCNGKRKTAGRFKWSFKF
jgi:hypothetical protein